MAVRNIADIVVHGRDGQQVAVVELKNHLSLSREDAAWIRENLMSRNGLEQPRYFLVLSQDLGYLWDANGQTQRDALPAVGFPMGPVVERYIMLDPGERLREHELELIVRSWLTELALGVADPAYEHEQTLARFNFLDAIRGSVTT